MSYQDSGKSPACDQEKKEAFNHPTGSLLKTAKVHVIGELPPLASREAVIRARILALLENLTEDWHEAAKCREWDWNTGKSRLIRKSYRWHWQYLRARIGGRVKAEAFRRHINELEEEGLVIEVWEVRHPRREAIHWVLLAENFDKHQWGRLVQAKGRTDILESLGLNELVKPVQREISLYKVPSLWRGNL